MQNVVDCLYAGQWLSNAVEAVCTRTCDWFRSLTAEQSAFFIQQNDIFRARLAAGETAGRRLLWPPPPLLMLASRPDRPAVSLLAPIPPSCFPCLTCQALTQTKIHVPARPPATAPPQPRRDRPQQSLWLLARRSVRPAAVRRRGRPAGGLLLRPRLRGVGLPWPWAGQLGRGQSPPGWLVLVERYPSGVPFLLLQRWWPAACQPVLRQTCRRWICRAPPPAVS